MQKKYKNCILNFIEEIFNKQTVFYECPKYDAIISIDYDPISGWHIAAIFGIKNDEISRDKKDAILAEFSKVNIDNRWITGLRYMIRFSDWNTFLKDL